jgi:hypothetical protein
MTSAIELARIYECEQTSRIGEVSRALIASEARVARLEEALRDAILALDHVILEDVQPLDYAGRQRLVKIQNAAGVVLSEAALRETGGSE